MKITQYAPSFNIGAGKYVPLFVIATLSKNNIVACGSAPLNAFGAGVNS